jgi:hypothetical protein
MKEDNDTEESNITKPFCQNVNLTENEMFAYRYVLVLVQYIIPVLIISFVYIQVRECSPKTTPLCFFPFSVIKIFLAL